MIFADETRPFGPGAPAKIMDGEGLRRAERSRLASVGEQPARAGRLDDEHGSGSAAVGFRKVSGISPGVGAMLQNITLFFSIIKVLSEKLNM
jgi:hypothetical protein